MIYQEYKPSKVLAPHVEKYLIFEDDAILQNRELTIVPGKTPEIAIHYGDPVDSFLNKPGEVKRGYLYGPHNNPGYFKSQGSIKCLCITFRPFGLNRIFGIPQIEVRNNAVELDNLSGPDGKHIIEMVNTAKSREEIINKTDSFLIRQFLKQKDIRAGIEQELEIIQRTKGKIKIHEMCTMLDINIKTLERRFKQLLGMTPKEYAGIIRLYHAYELSNSYPGADYNDIAHICGYYDQAHFINTVKSYTKLTPQKLFQSKEDHVIYVNRIYTY